MERAPIVALNIGNYDSSAVSDELSEVYGIQTRPGTLRTSDAQGTSYRGTGNRTI